MYQNTINLFNQNLSIFKKDIFMYVYVYNDNYYCLIKISNKFKPKLKTKNIIILEKNFFPLNLNFFFRQFLLCNFIKIKFTGKGYKIKKNTKNSLVLLFNKSHTTTIWWGNIFLKKLKKYKMYLKFTNINKKIINTIISIRPINIFTKKGLRTARQIILKKKGKK